MALNLYDIENIKAPKGLTVKQLILSLKLKKT